VEAVRRSVAEFQSVRRRFQPIGEAAGVTVIDDYAHHPTEVRATLAAARHRFPGRRLVCLFQPHTYTRTRYLLDDFRTCFADCDVLFITETYAAREEASAGMNAEQLTPEIRQPLARYTGNLEQSTEAVAEVLEQGDVFFTIGAGDVEKVAPMVLEALKAR
jgi:UDP-N-acetylmuramate--alanine ligase